jgi:cell division protein FtsB
MAVLPKVYAYGLALLGALAVGVLICIFAPALQKQRAMREKKVAIEAENRQLEESIKELQRRQAMFMTESSAVERTAHEANMVKSDEVVFKFATGTASAVEGRLP